MSHYVFSLGVIVFGFIAVVYTYQLVRIFGHIDVIERYFGYGFTYTFWKIAGIFLIAAGFYNLVRKIF